ncbi:MAG: hypothetical protein IBX69_16125 [Anaerolineales bacterium]|nr:hypothetical protein [Anaerolineales bacterium]
MLFSAPSASIRVPHQPMGDLAGRPYLPQPCHPYITQMLSVRLRAHFVRPRTLFVRPRTHFVRLIHVGLYVFTDQNIYSPRSPRLCGFHFAIKYR